MCIVVAVPACTRFCLECAHECLPGSDEDAYVCANKHNGKKNMVRGNPTSPDLIGFNAKQTQVGLTRNQDGVGRGSIHTTSISWR